VNIPRPLIPIIVIALLTACSSSEADWTKAESQNTVSAYEDFVKQHPNDAHDAQAHTRIQGLQDDQAWSDAQKTNTLEAYQQYLEKLPNGKHIDDAHAQVTALQRAAAWQAAQAANTVPAVQDFLQKYTQGPEVDQANALLTKLQAEGYRVQLATFHSDKEAQKSLPQLQARYSNELHDLVIIPPSGTDKLNRVSSGPMTLEDAKSACAKLKKSHQRCEVVKA
jgi:outer membrane protein assembly factor BamD (BamD/ComL family)